jgi:hypothetical protein
VLQAAFQSVFDELVEPSRSFTERQLIEVALDLELMARSAAPDQSFAGLVHALQAGCPIKATTVVALGPGKFSEALASTRAFGEELDRLRETKTVPRPRLQMVLGPPYRARLLPQRLTRDGQLQFRACFDDLDAALAFVMVLLANNDGALLDRLGKCELDTCAKYFLAPEGPGRPRRTYCCGEHSVEFHSRTVAQRVAKSRRKAARR